MATSGIRRPRARGPRITTVHTGAIIIAILSGSYALAALLVGSPLGFGLALALCGMCWIAAGFIEWTVEHEPAARRRAVPAARFNPGYGHAVFVGAREPLPSVQLPTRHAEKRVGSCTLAA